MDIEGPITGVQSACERVLRTLPRWFGIESALLEYAHNTAHLPTFVARGDAGIVGFLSLQQHFPACWEVNCVAIDLAWRGRGIGRRLQAAAEAWLVGQGAQVLQVKTLAASHPSPAYAETRRFYDALGFLPLEVFPTLWAPHLPVLQLVKPLRGAADAGPAGPGACTAGAALAQSDGRTDPAPAGQPAASGLRLARFDEAPDFVLQAIDTGLEDHNQAVAPLGDVRPLAVALFDAADRVVGGAVGRTWGRCCELLQLWVALANRRAGHGTALLRAFEQQGSQRGCNVFYLTTLSFQAPAFYARHGYQVLARIDGYPDGIAKFLMQRLA